MNLIISLSLCFLVWCSCVKAEYVLGAQGLSCTQVCLSMSMNCIPRIITNNSADIFTELGVKCTDDPAPWWAHNQPGYVSGAGDPNYQKCLGYEAVPDGVLCSGSYPTVQRICNCEPPTDMKTTFGTGLSAGEVTTDEQWIFGHVVADGDVGVMTHFWVTLQNPDLDGLIVRYYVDGETNASIVFQPSLAVGVGFADITAPWGTKWFGKGANDGAFNWNFRVPFQKSIAVTVAHCCGSYGGFYTIVRGGTNIPINIGNIQVPATAKLNQFVINQQYQPLEFISFAEVPAGNQGVVFHHTLAVSSGTPNFMEGCYHLYLEPNEAFPGTLLSTGMEDYYDSAWYFNAGEFHFENAGMTHFVSTNTNTQMSAYRFHEMDPIYFKNGVIFQWRNGDMVDAAGIKCMIQTGGTTVGNPTVSQVWAYTWVYTWN
eukprot:TRINITY_DN6532_c0_g1_i1.p1 TRINITY_DN6532_c0_g1~~TRINITY_DN6532_c0_g1_i1.p1  ORF type:complete len:428 (-),score=102.59 TRINITY_DN6532_c0_g1_i1:51-1334(-)